MLKQSLKAFKLFQHRFNILSTPFNNVERGWQTLSTLPFNKIERMLKQMLKPFARALRPPAINILELRLHHFGIIALDVGGAGDCFSRAVLHQLYVNPNIHGIIRVAGGRIVKGETERFIESNFEHSWIQYLITMSCQGTSCADSIIIQAVADVFNLKIILIIESHPDFC